MTAAQGEMQHMNYVSSFPALINVRGEATYIMVLKDQGGLVKLYAMVNVEQYNIVATGETQEDAKEAYLARLYKEGVLSPEDAPTPPAADTVEKTVTVDAITPVTSEGETVLYLRGSDADGNRLLFKANAAKNEALLLISLGDTVTFTVTATDNASIFDIVAVK